MSGSSLVSILAVILPIACLVIGCAPAACPPGYQTAGDSCTAAGSGRAGSLGTRPSGMSVAGGTSVAIGTTGGAGAASPPATDVSAGSAAPTSSSFSVPDSAAGSGGPADPRQLEAACTQENDVRCAGTGVGKRERCRAGTWVQDEPCATAEACVSGAQGATCQPRAAVCAGKMDQIVCDEHGVMLLCSADATAKSIDTCSSAGACVAGIASGTCAMCDPAGESTCDGDNLKQCNETGSGWQPVICEAGCDAASKRCRTCTPGAKQCLGDMLSTCDAGGQKSVTSACTGLTAHCSDGSCVQCAIAPDCAPRACSAVSCTNNACVYTERPGALNLTGLPDGSVVAASPEEDPTGAVFVIYGGAKFWIMDPATMARLYGGYGPDSRIQVIPQSRIDTLSKVPVDGTLLTEEGSGELYRYELNALHLIASSEARSACVGSRAPGIVPRGALADNALSKGAPYQ